MLAVVLAVVSEKEKEAYVFHVLLGCTFISGLRKKPKKVKTYFSNLGFLQQPSLTSLHAKATL